MLLGTLIFEDMYTVSGLDFPMTAMIAFSNVTSLARLSTVIFTSCSRESCSKGNVGIPQASTTTVEVKILWNYW